MHRRTVFALIWVVLGISIAALQLTAHTFYLYYLWWWADIVMHFLGGFFVALGILWFIRFEVPISWRHYVPVFLTTLIGTLAVGVGWEVFERVFDAYAARNYVLDTTLDILMDIVGMLAAYFVFLRYGK